MSIYEKIKNGDYETKLAYPKNPDKKCHMCNHGIVSLVHIMDKDNIVKFCSNCGTAVKAEYEKRQEAFKVDQLAYNSDRLRLNVMFKTDALQYCGIGNHKKADKAWDMACNYANDNNIEFMGFLEELAEVDGKLMTLIQTLKFIIKVQETGKIAEGLQLLKSLVTALEDGKHSNFFPAFADDEDGLIKAAKIQAEQNNIL